MSENVLKDAVALALAQGHTQKEAAEIGECTERTVRRWLAEDPVFVQTIRDVRSAALDAGIGVLLTGFRAAAEQIVKLATQDNPPSSVKLAAAKAVVTLARDFKSIEEIEQRLDELESMTL